MRWGLAPLGAMIVYCAATCGGIAVLDGTGAEGGANGSSARAATTTNTSGPAPTNAVSTGPSYECEQACGALYDCALGVDPEGEVLCPGFTGSSVQRQDFVGYCIDTTIGCQAALQYVKPHDCLATVSYFKSNNTEFAYMCKYGTEG